MIETSTLVLAFSLTLFAGLATGIGSAIAFFAKRTNTKFLSVALGFSAGVMIYVSFVEIFAEARESLISASGTVAGTWITVASFFGGMLIVALIDRLIPTFENPHEIHMVEEMRSKPDRKCRRCLYRMGILTALAIAVHNFPEGLATFASAINDIHLGVMIAFAIALHNIPEGIAVSVPLYYATGSRKKAFLYSFLSGLAEPIGALVGFTILYSLFNGIVFGMLFAVAAGIMVFISLDQLLPAAHEYGEHHLSIYGLLAGMGTMALSLLLFL
ncbi:zinc transporter ZupT [Candidatus Woesearchaeota archaeon]|nr:zinc transporter ZupT [Candidatus Woesearchaeota archaeon]